MELAQTPQAEVHRLRTFLSADDMHDIAEGYNSQAYLLAYFNGFHPVDAGDQPTCGCQSVQLTDGPEDWSSRDKFNAVLETAAPPNAVTNVGSIPRIFAAGAKAAHRYDRYDRYEQVEKRSREAVIRPSIIVRAFVVKPAGSIILRGR